LRQRYVYKINLNTKELIDFQDAGSYDSFVTKTLLQGSILNPLLFNLFLSRIKECVVKEAEFLQYADDIVIFADSNLLEALSKVQKTLNNITISLATEV